MQVEQLLWSETTGWSQPRSDLSANLVLVFGGRQMAEQSTQIDALRVMFPEACVTGCSTAGGIYGTDVIEDGLIATAIEFESTTIQCCQTEMSCAKGSFSAGADLAERLPHEELAHVLILSEGLSVNGSELVRGLLQGLPDDVVVTGGLSADGERFSETFVVPGSGSPTRHVVSCVGFYGSTLRIGSGSYGGWSPFGPRRRITRSNGNVLYELDGKSALDVYKKYLGENAAQLPGSGLHFPLSIQSDDDPVGVVRTILSINEEQGSLTFAGDVPERMTARLMHANLNRLIDGAAEAAKQCGTKPISNTHLALLVSCVGRKMVLKQRVEEEIEAVQFVLGGNAVLAGFYSYGEISTDNEGFSHVYNQTMTITTFYEC